MFKSRAVAKVNPSNSCSTVLTLSIGNSFLVYFPKVAYEAYSVILFGYDEGGWCHFDVGWNSNTPRSHSLFSSLIVVSLRDFGTGNGLKWYGLAPSFNAKKIGSVFQLPSDPSKSSSISVSNSSNLFWSWWVRLFSWCKQLIGGLPFHIWHLGCELLV